MVVEGLHGKKNSSSRPLKSDSSSASSSHTKLRTNSDSNEVRLLNCNNIWSWHGPPSLCAIISLVESSVYEKLIHYQDNWFISKDLSSGSPISETSLNPSPHLLKWIQLVAIKQVQKRRRKMLLKVAISNYECTQTPAFHFSSILSSVRFKFNLRQRALPCFLPGWTNEPTTTSRVVCDVCFLSCLISNNPVGSHCHSLRIRVSITYTCIDLFTITSTTRRHRWVEAVSPTSRRFTFIFSCI